jgi:hypothetical protein
MAKTIAQTKGNKLNLINSILQPYLSGHKSRIDGIYPLYLLIDTFVMQVNKFLKDKKLQYSLRNGFKIVVHPTCPALIWRATTNSTFLLRSSFKRQAKRIHY